MKAEGEPAVPTILTDDEFIARFRPEKDQQGCYYRQRYFSEPQDFAVLQAAANENRIWTMLDCMTLTNGLHRVNRCYHVVTEVPYDPSVFYEIPDDEAGDTDE